MVTVKKQLSRNKKGLEVMGLLGDREGKLELSTYLLFAVSEYVTQVFNLFWFDPFIILKTHFLQKTIIHP